jgi:hypothetical protein
MGQGFNSAPALIFAWAGPSCQTPGNPLVDDVV